MKITKKNPIWKAHNKDLYEEFQGQLNPSSIGKIVRTSWDLGLTKQQTREILEYRVYSGRQVPWKIVKQIADKTHIKWRLYLLTLRYTKFSLKKNILLYGVDEGTLRYEKTKKLYGTASLESWMSRGYTEEQAREKMKDAYGITLENCIRRHGEFAGTKMYDQLSEKKSKMQKELHAKGELKFGYETSIWNFDKYLDQYDGDEELAKEKQDADIAHWKKQLRGRDSMLASGMTESEIVQIFREGSQRCIEYWIKNGMTDEQAKCKVGEVQNRSLDYFIEKYGPDEGERRWRTKVETWRKSLYDNKTAEELAEINSRKGGKNCGVHRLKSVPETIPGRLYIIKHKVGEFIKVGISTKAVSDRYQNFHRDWELISENSIGLARAKELESTVLERFTEYKRVFPEYVSIETLTIDCLDELCSFVNGEIE